MQLIFFQLILVSSCIFLPTLSMTSSNKKSQKNVAFLAKPIEYNFKRQEGVYLVKGKELQEVEVDGRKWYFDKETGEVYYTLNGYKLWKDPRRKIYREEELKGNQLNPKDSFWEVLSDGTESPGWPD